MTALPLHPALTHLPLGLSLVAPFALFWALWATRRGEDRRVWALPAVLQLLVLLGGVLAYQTGSREEERVERRVPEAALETHEDRAQVFLGAAAAAALLAAGALATRGRTSRWLGGLAAGASFATLGLGLAVGHAGGALVYRYGAASAAVSASAPSAISEPKAHDDED
ncbi:MAG TPA: DUF2231 domain-containing protein [Holophagaceae bacterium]|nr:DUF2231 domain-containing protein [Holophagaceae bacterium]